MFTVAHCLELPHREAFGTEELHRGWRALD